MNKNAVKTYAIWARNELITRVTQKAFEYGVSKDNIIDANVDSINGNLLTSEEKKQRQQLIKEINNKGFDQVIEEVAYTWFNRFIALRYMEVNNYLPNRIRVFTNDSNEFKPQILDEAMNLELDCLDKNEVYALIDTSEDEKLYKLLLLATCNDMHNYLPGMFETIDDYKVLLFPDNLLRKESIIGRMINDIDEDSWLDQVQIIGWMYQYYVAEKHNEVINLNKSTVKKEDIPAATQLFTTDWVVRYMVDNSLGRYWVERNPDSPLKNKLQYLATSKNGDLPYINEKINCEDLTFIDPCMGSGHILVYAFDVLLEIYRECGYSDRDAAQAILENNLYGLDLDDRASQLSYFAVMMKARAYNRRILTRNVSNNISSITESNNIKSYSYQGMEKNDEMDKIGNYLVSIFKDAKELGSLIEVKSFDYVQFESWITKIKETSEYTLDLMEWASDTYPILISLSKQAQILSRKYKAVTTNPPYLSRMEGNLKKYVSDNYKEYKSDLFAVFIKRNFEMTDKDGYLGFMTPYVWMFIKSYEELRKFVLNNKSITTLIQLEYSAYDEATVPICTFVLSNRQDNNIGYYYRLTDFKGGMEIQRQKILEAQSNKNDCKYFYEANKLNFTKIPGSPIAYWGSKTIFDDFDKADLIGDIIPVKKGLDTGNNDKYLRLWYEINYLLLGIRYTSSEKFKSDMKKWAPHDKGGEFRRWYGNNDWVINWENNGYELHHSKANLRSEKYYFSDAITWSSLSSGKISFRCSNNGAISNTAGSSMYPQDKYNYYLALENSNVAQYIYDIISPTLNYSAGPISQLPLLLSNQYMNTIFDLVNENISISKLDWDSYETSWDFKYHLLLLVYSDILDYKFYIKDFYATYKHRCNERFEQLKNNEVKLNEIFIGIYGLQNELDPHIEDKDVTVHYVVDTKEEAPFNSNYIRTREDEIKSLISYAVGCMFGRYSLDTEGLAYAGGEWDNSKYSSFIPDNDNIIPICDDEYFSDDIVGRFVEFIKVVYGEDTLEENLKFISDALGGNGAPREVIRNYFLNSFFKDHCNTYQVTGSGKRPIYWLFDSGKKNGFKALIYIHRYTPDLIARMRTQYVHEQQARYRNQMEMLQNQLDSDINASERVRLNKQLKKFKEQDAELRVYEEKIHHWADKMEPMDLDDGVKANYSKFQELLAKIK